MWAQIHVAMLMEHGITIIIWKQLSYKLIFVASEQVLKNWIAVILPKTPFALNRFTRTESQFAQYMDEKNEKDIFWMQSLDKFIYLVRLKLTFISGKATFCPGKQVFRRNKMIPKNCVQQNNNYV